MMKNISLKDLLPKNLFTKKIFDLSRKKIFTFFSFLGGLSSLASQSFYWLFIPPFKKERLYEQCEKAGVESFPIISLVSFFIGVIMALQTAYQMQRLGAEMYIASIVALSMVRELGPVITALVVAGRVGASITAEIGSMQVTEQVDALQTLATNPIKYLVVPRLLALSIMLPILTLYSNIIGIFGGYLMCVYKLGVSPGMYRYITFSALLYKDLFTGLFKAVFFGMIIALVSCYEGFRVEGGAEGVGKATALAVVTMFIMIIACDCFFTALFYFIFP